MTSDDHQSGTSGRIIPPRAVELPVDDIRDLESGNYLFSFGYPGSGKSTFQWMMMNYLMNEGPFFAKIVVPDRANGPSWEGRRIINSWKTQWSEGRFPDPTPARERDIREVSVNARTTKGKKLGIDFSFLEASGELLRQVVPGSDKAPGLAPLLRAYFDNPRLKFAVLLMLNPDVEENDQLFASFMSYLENNFSGLHERMSLGVIVTKPEDSLRRLQTYGAPDGIRNFPQLDTEALLTYVNRFCGETYQIWDNWPEPKKTLVSPLYLGETEMIEGEPRLVKPDFRHIEQIFFWVFEQFTGKCPGPTLWQRIIGRLDWK